MAKVLPNQYDSQHQNAQQQPEIPDSDRNFSNLQRPLTIFYFQTFGQSVHFLYQSSSRPPQQSGIKQTYHHQNFNSNINHPKHTRYHILMSAVEQQNLFQKSHIRLYSQNNYQFATLQHKQNVLQFFFYPFFANKFILKALDGSEIGVIKQSCCRGCKPLICCGKINACSNQSFQVYDKKQKCILTIQGNLECACSSQIHYTIYGEDSKQKIGQIKEYHQCCAICPYPFSCTQMYSPLVQRTFKMRIATDIEQHQQYRQILFSSLIFLSKITKSYFY